MTWKKERTVDAQINYYYSRPAVEGDEGYEPDDPVSYSVLEFDNDSSTNKTVHFADYYDDDDEADAEPLDSASAQVVRMLQAPFKYFDFSVEKGDWKMYAKEEEFPRDVKYVVLNFYSETVDTKYSEGAVEIEIEIRAVDGWEEWELMEIWTAISGKPVKGPDVDLTDPGITANEQRMGELEMMFEDYMRTHPEAPDNYMLVSIILGKSDEYYRLLEEFGGL
jgi:hypothetical protein